MRIPFPQDDGTLTPYTFELGYPLVTLVYDTLTWRDEAGVPRPWLARSVHARPGRVVVRLRRGARWHDGRAVTARDVAFTFRHVRRRPHPRFTPQLAAIERVRAPGRRTVVFELRHAAPAFSDQPLADVPILPRHLWRGLPPDRLAPPGLPVGSGPYRLVSHRAGRGYAFRANRGYHLGTPAVGEIEVPVVPGAAATLRALDRGAVDMVPVTLPAPARRQLDELGVAIAQGPGYTGTMLMFNLRRRPFSAPAARRAVVAAVDATQVARELPGAIAASRGFVHPASAWAPPVPPPGPTRGAGAVRPFTVLVAANDPIRVAAAQQVVRDLRRAGLRASVRELAPRALAAAVGQDGARPDFEAAIWSTPALASYDPDYLRVMFGEGMPLNYSGYRSDRFAAAAARVARATGNRQAAVADELAVLARELPALPLFFHDGVFAYRPAAHSGWVFVKGTGILDKRSFMSGGSPPRPPAASAPPRAETASFPGTFGWLALAALVAAAAVAVASARRRG